MEVSQIPEADETRQVEYVPPPTFPFSPSHSHSPDHSWGSPTKFGDTAGEAEGGGGGGYGKGEGGQKKVGGAEALLPGIFLAKTFFCPNC